MKVRLQVTLDPEIAKRTQALGEQREQSLSSVIADALDSYLDRARSKRDIDKFRKSGKQPGVHTRANFHLTGK